MIDLSSHIFRKPAASLLTLLSVIAFGLACEDSSPSDEALEESKLDSTTDADAEQNPDLYAVVNGREITRQEVDGRVERLHQLDRRQRSRPSRKARSRHRERVVQRLIDRELLRDHIASNDIEICDDAVDDALQRRIDSQFGGEPALQAYLESEGRTVDDLRHQVRDELAIETLVGDSIDPDAIDDDTLRIHYDRLANRRPAQSRVRVDRIQVHTSGDGLRELLDGFGDDLSSPSTTRDRLQDTLEPDHLELSADQWLQPYQLPNPMAALLFGDSAIDNSPHVHRHSRGIDIYWAHEHRPPGPRQFDEVEDRLRQRVHRAKVEQYRRQLLEDLRQNATITVHFNGPPSHDEQ